ncbi:NAD(P)H-hydrate dehydratase [Alkalicoccus urumqiensis]|uniref:Bifunctional NAD(P)H-hydrate repair enzyme n=1 Tax=Alkalicoccus urumqiensis TaxID=1548213 RepID=A0A2P6MLD4_ALKUR|nr:NAD(P)H-hydrate dehydratase [Alkalicoccus urumqiensis]PRO67091.1 bifunctional ADP-dependent NAD(P)H-hydrate dehydratase/NAD(P)H-hydrate epimerase [Alkalicoccus urumqiensis]
MYVVSREEMRAMDAHTIESVGIPSMVLMENAGREAAELAALEAEEAGPSWAVLVGKGNNGGDGIVAARHLAALGLEPVVIFAEDPGACVGEAARQRDIMQEFAVERTVYEPGKIAWERFDGVMDALLGTGTAGAPREPYAGLIREANAAGLPVVAIDIPSGLDADTGKVYDPCIAAVKTAALAYTKRGLEQYPGRSQAGEITVCDIGIPPKTAEDFGIQTVTADALSIADRFGIDVVEPYRGADTHKGTYGHARILAGTRRMLGAGLLSSTAALRSGAGLVTWGLPDTVLASAAGHQPEIMLEALADGGTGTWENVSADEAAAFLNEGTAGAIGPGMGRWSGDTAWLQHIWENTTAPIVVDADALNILADADWQNWKPREGEVILTPHPGEMARLSGKKTKDVQTDRIETARRFAVDHGVTVVLKGARTVTASADGFVSINTTGNPFMASGGAGDVLTGMTAAFLARGMTGEEAAVCAVYLHGRAGDQAAEQRPGSQNVTAGDIISAL